MLRSMADPFELNAAFLCDPTREKAKEQSPQALLFCIRINRFYLAASNSASISAEGAGVTRLTTTQTIRDTRKAGSSS